MADLPEAVVLDLNELPEDLRALIIESRESGRPVLLTDDNAHFVIMVSPITDAEMVRMAARALEIAEGTGA